MFATAIGAGWLGWRLRLTDRRCAAACLRSAQAMLGEHQAAVLRDALAERAAQAARVTEAAAVAPRHPGPAPTGSPGPARVAAWQRCRDRIEALEADLAAWAWQAPVAAGPGPGSAAGALDGYVAGVKDVIDVAGMPTRAGSPLTSPDPVPADAPAVARLRAASAAIGSWVAVRRRSPAEAHGGAPARQQSGVNRRDHRTGP